MPAIATHHPPLQLLEQQHKASFWGSRSREASSPRGAGPGKHLGMWNKHRHSALKRCKKRVGRNMVTTDAEMHHS
eukprot:1136712-Pelagomonas_calceolata.AAC.5